MGSFRSGVVVQMIAQRTGLQRVMVRIAGEDQRAYNITDLTGEVIVGDEVVCNTTAVALGLGTGGWHVVHWNLARRSLDTASGGHIMKLRYTSLQANTGAAEEDAPNQPTTSEIAHVPVVVCSLHSQMAVAAVAFARFAPHRRLVYVMTDGAALPIVISDLVHDLIGAGILAATVTAGNAFGGHREAVTVSSALLSAAGELEADAIIVAMGPGVTGTGTPYGTTALEVGAIIDDIAHLGGKPIACVRASEADPRARHRGISHHTLTALRRATADVSIAVPIDHADLIAHARLTQRTMLVDVPDVGEMLHRVGLVVTTMGRGPSEDPMFFRFAAAAGLAAAQELRT